jgi:hypothetical protein
MTLLYRFLYAIQDFYKNNLKCCIFANFYLFILLYLDMDKQKAITLAGSQSELARLLGISRGAVHQWKTIPTGRLYQLMVLKPEWFDNK